MFHFQSFKPTVPSNITLVHQIVFVSQITFVCHQETAMSASVLMEFMKDATTLLTLLIPFVTSTKTTQGSIRRQLERLQNVLSVKNQVGKQYIYFIC